MLKYMGTFVVYFFLRGIEFGIENRRISLVLVLITTYGIVTPQVWTINLF